MAGKEKKEEKAPEKKKKKKGGGKVIFVLILIIIILLLLMYLFGDGMGFGFGGSGDGDSVAVNATVTAEQAEETMAVENAEIVVEVTEDRIIFDGTGYNTYEEFEKFFYENDFKDRSFILRDNKAVKSVYDSVKKLLDSFGGNYLEEIV